MTEKETKIQVLLKFIRTSLALVNSAFQPQQVGL